MADNYCKCCGDGTPEYIIELNQQGAPGKRGEKGDEGYSPVVDFIADDNEIRFISTNENNVTSTPNLYDYILKKDGTNSANPITLNKIFIRDNNIYTSRNDLLLGNTDTDLYNLNIRYGILNLKSYNPEIRNTSGDLTLQSEQDLYIRTLLGNKLSLNNSINIIGGTPYIGTQEPNNKIATIGDIPEVSDSKITISQGDVVKGSFTLNQSGDTTIELDTGITNPLKIEGATEENPSGGTITYGMELGLDSSNKVYLDYITSYYTSTGGLNYSISENIIKDNIVVGIPEIKNSIAELTTLADNTEASLNELKTDYESNKTEVAEELTNLGNQLNNKADKTELIKIDDTTTSDTSVWSSNKINSEITTVASEVVGVQGDVASLDALISTMSNTIATLTARVEALEAEINGGNA